MRTFTKNKRILLAASMLTLVSNMSVAQTVWDFTDASIWQDQVLTSGNYSALGKSDGKDAKVTFSFEENAVAYENGVKITADGSSSSNYILANMPGNGYISALVKVSGEGAKAHITYGKTEASGTGKYFCLSNPNNAARGGNSNLFVSDLNGESLTIEKIARHTNSSETSLELGSTGVTTLYPATVVKFSDATAVKVYVIKKVTNGVAELEEVSAENPLAGFQGYIIKGTPNTSYTLSIQRAVAELDTENMLKGAVAATTVSSDEQVTRYFLTTNDNGDVCFKKVASDTESAARKAWLEIPSQDNSARFLSIAFPNGGTTGINNVKKDNASHNIYYDLNGVGKQNPSKGVNIVNGKKVIFK